MHKNNYRYTNDNLPPMDGAGDYPIAMAYVPWQKEPKMYENLEEGFCNGTIFPELNKPFCGKR